MAGGKWLVSRARWAQFEQYAVLVATLGSEAQVIPLATQLLLRQGEPLTHTVVLHTRADRHPIDRALPIVQASFPVGDPWPQLQTLAVPTDDVLTPDQIELFARHLYQVLKTWIARRVRVHLLLAGGRKSMTMVGMTVAQMLLGPDDRIWYLHSDEELRTAGRTVLQPGDTAQLIAIPLPQVNVAPPVFTQPFTADTPDAARDAYATAQQQRQQRFVAQELTDAEREVAALVVQDVLTVAEIAQTLNKKPKTVTNQLNSIYSKLEAEFGLQPDVGVKREFLRRTLRGYFG